MKWKLRHGRRAVKAAPKEGDVPPGDSEQPADCEQPAASDQFESEVFAAERRYLENRWQSVGSSDREIDDAAPGAAPTTANNLVGLALSGGGIRSATFNLGLLQSLHRHGVFRHVDYLSTVSGGGFLGSSVSTLMGQKARREEPEPKSEFPLPDSDRDKEAPELTYLRNNSNYLAQNGLLDYLRLASVLVRGILLNFLVLVPLILVGSMVVILAYGQQLLDRIHEDDDVQRLAVMLERHWTGMENLADAKVVSLTESLEDWSMLAIHRDRRTRDVLRALREATDAHPLIVGGPGNKPEDYRFRSDATREKIVRALWQSETLQSLDALEEIAAIEREVETVEDSAGPRELLEALGPSMAVDAVPDAATVRSPPGLPLPADDPAVVSEAVIGDAETAAASLDPVNPMVDDVVEEPARTSGRSGLLRGGSAGVERSLEALRNAGFLVGKDGNERFKKDKTRRQVLHELYVQALYDPRGLERIVEHPWGSELTYWQFVELAQVRAKLESQRLAPTECFSFDLARHRKCVSEEWWRRLCERPGEFLVEDVCSGGTDEFERAIAPLKTGSERGFTDVARNLYYDGLLAPRWFDADFPGLRKMRDRDGGQGLGNIWDRFKEVRGSSEPFDGQLLEELGDLVDWGGDEREDLSHGVFEYMRYYRLAEARRNPGRSEGGVGGPASDSWNPYRVRLPATVNVGLVGLVWMALFPLLLWLRRLVERAGAKPFLLLLGAAQLLLIALVVALFSPTVAVGGLAVVGIVFLLARRWSARLWARPGGRSCLLLLLGAAPLLVSAVMVAAGWSELGATTKLAAGLAVLGIACWLVRPWLGRLSSRQGKRPWLQLPGVIPAFLIVAVVALVWLELSQPLSAAHIRIAKVAAGLAPIGIAYWMVRRLRRVKSALWWRDIYERSFSGILILTSAVAFVELQPYLIYHYSHLRLDAQWIAALGGASLLSVLSAGPVLSALKSVGKILAMVVIVLLGPILPMLIYIEVVIRSLYSDDLWNTAYSLDDWNVIVYFGLAAVLFHFINLPLDINSTSMHAFYRDRLSRAYLIRREEGDKVVPEDDLSLRDISLEGSGAPYHLINAALNLQGTSDPAMRRRHSDFFTFSRDFIGGARTGYCKTEHMEEVFPHIHLSSAMAVSAAAAAPNMGTFTFGPLVVLMALLNIRLGFWLPNPSRVNLWKRPGTSRLVSIGRKIGFGLLAFFGSFRARPGAYALIKEMLSLMHDRSRFVNLSDGGHIENTGAYELLRRRCRFIVIGDAEADPGMSFPGLATLVRYARIDLGIDIEVHVDDLRRQPDGESLQHCAIGFVRYPEREGEPQEPGLLLYVKSSLTGDEDQVVAEYRARNTDFPHESTADQAFNEGQFEAYRALGFHIGEGLFEPRTRIDTFDAFRLWFEGLRVTLSPGLASRLPLAEIDAELADISDLLRQPELEGYFYELYPDLKPRDYQPERTVSSGEAFRKVFHVVDRQLRLMQTLFRTLELGQRGNLAHPSNRGWINLFRRWAQAPTFKRIYLRTISTCSGPFQQFCESALGLKITFRWRHMRRKQILLGMPEPAGVEETDAPGPKVGQLVAEVKGVRETLVIGHARLLPGGAHPVRARHIRARRVSVGLRDGYQGAGMLAKAEMALDDWALKHHVTLDLGVPTEVLPESGEPMPLEIAEPDAEDTEDA
jgi:hypothetical protein